MLHKPGSEISETTRELEKMAMLMMMTCCPFLTSCQCTSSSMGWILLHQQHAGTVHVQFRQIIIISKKLPKIEFVVKHTTCFSYYTTEHRQGCQKTQYCQIGLYLPTHTLVPSTCSRLQADSPSTDQRYQSPQMFVSLPPEPPPHLRSREITHHLH